MSASKCKPGVPAERGRAAKPASKPQVERHRLIRQPPSFTTEIETKAKLDWFQVVGRGRSANEPGPITHGCLAAPYGTAGALLTEPVRQYGLESPD